MKREWSRSVLHSSIFTWVGFVAAISFMESWLKFQAPGVDLITGLNIGRIVFDALNKVELVLMVIVLSSLLLGRKLKFSPYLLWLLIPCVILIIQSLWLLPMLDLRAQARIDGLPVPPSNLHFVYIGTELIKVVCLITFGFISSLKN